MYNFHIVVDVYMHIFNVVLGKVTVLILLVLHQVRITQYVMYTFMHYMFHCVLFVFYTFHVICLSGKVYATNILNLVKYYGFTFFTYYVIYICTLCLHKIRT
jgi:hypothetical protein